MVTKTRKDLFVNAFKLFVSFFRIGFLTFGGGLAMIPFIQDEFINRKHWIAEDEMVDIISLAQTFPGVVAVNTSIFVGHKIAGLMGAILAVLGTVLPALLSIVLILSVLVGFEENRYVQMVFVGIKATSAALILEAVIRLARKAIVDMFGVIMAGVVLLLVVVGVNAAWGILLGAAAGLAYHKYSKSK